MDAPNEDQVGEQIDNPTIESLRLIVQSQLVLHELQINQRRLEGLIQEIALSKDKP